MAALNMPVRFGRPLATRRWNRSLGKHISWILLACASQIVWDFRMDVDMWLHPARSAADKFQIHSCQADMEPWPSSIQRPWYLQCEILQSAAQHFASVNVSQWPRMLGMGFGFEESKLCLEARQKAFPRFYLLSLCHAICSQSLFIPSIFSRRI